MNEFLIDHAIKNVWCSPEQDLQAIFKPARITRFGGVEGSARVLWGVIPLPTPRGRYHLYQIGQLHPKLIGLFSQRNVWQCVANVMGRETLIMDIYSKKGVQIPRAESWVLVNDDQNLILAIKDQQRLPVNFHTESIYFRFYSNAYFDSLRSNNAFDKIECVGARIVEITDLLAIQNKFNERVSQTGHAYAFHNGYAVGNFTLATVQVGDYVEYVYDSSIKRVVDVNITDLPTFDSLLDLKRKYLVHYPEFGNEIIEYRDDVDFFLINKDTTPALFKGIYYHRNQDDSVRMVTHKDYSIPVPYVSAYAADNASIGSVDDFTLRIHVRKSGYDRPLIHDHHRIKELYKLDDQQVKNALLGIDSVVDEWRADRLEASDYCRLMQSRHDVISQPLVQNAYGYNAISKLLADTPTAVQNSAVGRVAKLPSGLRNAATVYEYDNQGYLTGFYRHTAGEDYRPVINETVMVEAVVGLGGNTPSNVYDKAIQAYDPKFNYRFYKCPIRNGAPTEVWVDVTGTADYEIKSGEIRWKLDRSRWLTMVRSDERFVSYSLNLARSDGLLRFTLMSNESRVPGIVSSLPIRVPYGELDLWLNGRPIIEGLDYFVKWPQIVIVNKEYLNPGLNQNITVRTYGFCKPDLTREPKSEFGFVDHGILSRNKRFDIRDDKVVRFVAGGALRKREDLIFSEDDSGVRVSNIPNGTPYTIDDPMIPLRDLISVDSYEFRAISKDLDKRISDYLTLRLPEPTINTPNAIPSLYQIYSPFCSKIIHDIVEGFIGGSEIQEHYSNAQIVTWLKDYEYLLDYDPTRKTIDRGYVSIQPHNLFTVIEVNVYQYRFLERVISLYLDNSVDLTRFVKIRAFA